MTTTLVLADFQVLGIPADRWPQVLEDSRVLAYEAWRERHVAPCPARVRADLWEVVARRVYREGPLVYFMATHVN